MTIATRTRPNARIRPIRKAEKPSRRVLPAQPDERLWKTDHDKAFEAGVQWFLAVSRTA